MRAAGTLIMIMRFRFRWCIAQLSTTPEHQKVMAFNQPFVADVASVDFE
jgi:hypothetical protein